MWDASSDGKVSDYSEKRDVTRSYRISRPFTYESNLGTICNIVLRQLPDLRFATYPSHSTSAGMTLVILIHESTHVYLTYSPEKESLLRNSYSPSCTLHYIIIQLVSSDNTSLVCQLKVFYDTSFSIPRNIAMFRITILVALVELSD